MRGCFRAMPGLSLAKQQRAGFCRMVRLGCGSNPRNIDALVQKHSNWKARRAKDTRPSRLRQVAKAMLAHFQEMAGMTFLKRPLISDRCRVGRAASIQRVEGGQCLPMRLFV
jgi:hypothetical protein